MGSLRVPERQPRSAAYQYLEYVSKFDLPCQGQLQIYIRRVMQIRVIGTLFAVGRARFQKIAEQRAVAEHGGMRKLLDERT